MSEPTPTEDVYEDALERFARLYGTPERGAQLWNQWIASQDDNTRAIMEQVATNFATENEITVEEARTYLALQKLLQDRGLKFAEKYLKQHDQESRPLKPMILGKKKR